MRRDHSSPADRPLPAHTPTKPDATLDAFGRLLMYVYASSGVLGAPGTTTIRPAGEAFEILVEGKPIGLIARSAILEVADGIRLERGN